MTDKKMMREFMEADTAEKAYASAREAGFQGSAEDFKKMVQDELAKSSVNELTDKDLEAVAGGGMDKEKWRSMSIWQMMTVLNSGKKNWNL